MNPVAEALADGVAPIRLEAAAHEIGHGIVWRHHGFPVARIVVTNGLFSPVGKAYCRLTRIPFLDAGNAEGYLIGLMGGMAAHVALRARHLHTGPGAARTHAGHDISEYHRLAGPHGCRRPIGSATSRAGSVPAGYGHARIDRLTARLARTGALPGGAL